MVSRKLSFAERHRQQMQVNRFAALMQERRAGNSANGSYRVAVGNRQRRMLINHYAFMLDKRNRSQGYGFARNG